MDGDVDFIGLRTTKLVLKKIKIGDEKMYNEPTEEELNKVPKLYDTENIPLPERDVYFHFFCGNSDWWILEYDPKNRLFFGIAKIFECELGYISFDEMRDVRVFGAMEVDRDLHFGIKKIKEIEELKEWLKTYGDI